MRQSMARDVHLLVSLGKSNRLLSVAVPLVIVRVAIGVLILIPLITGYLAIDKGRRTADRSRLAVLQYENAVLRGKMDFLAAGVDSLKQEMKKMVELDAQLRLSAGMTLPSRDVRAMGIGGGTVGSSEPGAELQSSIDWLLSQARFQRTSYYDIASNLEKQSFLQTHTPSIMPTSGWITSSFGNRKDPLGSRTEFHQGIDIVGAAGQPIRATADGTVTIAGPYQNWGNVVEIDHGKGLRTFYAHNQSVTVRVGDFVKRGQQIAKLGRTGRSTGNHCHYGVKLNGNWVDPAKYLLSDRSEAR